MPGFTELRLNNSKHPSSLLRGLRMLQEHSHLLCDCMLLIDEHEFPIHRVVFAASSEYFRALFTTNLKENGSSVITLNGISAQTFQLVSSFIYSGEVTLDQANITDVYAAADMLQLKDLLDLCQDYFLNQLCASNCIGIWQYARSFSNHKLKDCAWLYITTHFTKVMEREEFLDLDPADAHLILSYDKLELDSERDACLAMHKWLHHNTEMRNNEFIKLVPSIRNHKLLPLEILKEKQSAHTHKLRSNCAVVNQEPGTISPASLRSLAVVGGYNNGPEKTCEKYSQCTSSWKVTDWILSDCKHFHWVGVIGLRLYAIAGSGLTKINRVMSRLTCMAAEQLQTNALETGWEYEATLPHDCSNMKFCVMNENIYGCGEITDNTFGIGCYNPSNGSWELVTDIISDSKVFFQFFSRGDKLYLLGGLCTSSGMASCYFESYNPHSNYWEQHNEMGIARYNFGVGILDRCLYAIGGVGVESDMLSSVERYCFETKEWSLVGSLPAPRASMACEGWRGQLFCVGGETVGTDCVQTSDVLKFDPAADKWEVMASLNHPRIYSSTIIL